MLLPLFVFLDLINQLDDVGKGVYDIWHALRYELQMLPRRALDLLPFAALMGSTMALARLALEREAKKQPPPAPPPPRAPRRGRAWRARRTCPRRP